MPLHNPTFTLSITRQASSRIIKCHKSILHYLFYTTRLHPDNVETIQPIQWCQTYQPAFNTIISADKEAALTLANSTNHSLPIRIYSDGSGYKGGIGAAAMLYQGNRVIDTLHYYLGPDTEHTVYEGKVVSITLGFYMFYKLNCQLTETVLIGLDNQVELKALNNQCLKPGHYLLNKVHDAAEALHAKQDKLFNARLLCETWAWEETWKSSTCDVIDIRLQWVPGHMDFAPNKKADKEAKHAAQGLSSPSRELLKYLWKQPPVSVPALQQQLNAKLQRHWACQWKASPCYQHLHLIDNSAPSKKFLTLTKTLSHWQSSIMMQLCTSCIGLNQWLFHIKQLESPSCLHCLGITVETV